MKPETTNSVVGVVRHRARNVVRGCVSLLQDRTILALSVLFGIAAAGLLWHQSRQRSRLVESIALQQAVLYSEAIAEFRTLYNSEVVQTARDHGIQVTYDYQDKEGAIPLPATLTKQLGDRLAKRKAGGRTRLYSPYPFPQRNEMGGLRDDFAREAWKVLSHRPAEPFYRFEDIDGRLSLRYATADRMRASCVRCHNSHPDTPKRDWKVGDVRGVLEVVSPLDAAIAQTHADMWESSSVTAGLLVLGLTCTGFVVIRLRRTSTEMKRQVDERTQTEEALRESQAILSDHAQELARSNEELEQTNADLNRSRSAAINMMRDAEDDHRKAEEARRALGQQAVELERANDGLQKEVLERKQVEAELQKVSRAVEQSPASVVITDVQGTIEYVNPKFTQVTGYTLQEVIGETPSVLNSGKIPKETIKQLWETILSGREWRGELLNKKKNGELYWEFASISPLVNADGKTTHFVAVKENITQRKLTDAALRDSESRHRTLFESSGDAIMLLGKEGYIDCNSATLQIFGLTDKKDFISVHPAELSPPRQLDGNDSYTAAEERIATALRVGSAKFEWTHQRGEGERFPAEVWLTAFDMGGERILQATVRDISERKRADAELVRLHEELVVASRLAGMSEVATGVLHNVGNVLNSVNVSANLLIEKVQTSRVGSLAKASDMICQHQSDLAAFLTTDGRGRHFPRLLEELVTSLSAERDTQLEELRSLIDNIGHIREIVSTQQSFAQTRGTTEPVNLTELMEDALKINDAGLIRHNVNVVREFGEVPPIVTERHQVLQIIVNLISNARYALSDCDQDNRTMTLIVTGGEENVLIEVRDNGVGIAHDNLTNIFSHGFTTREDGHGFGLHSSALSAQEVGGSLSVDSDGVGQGATFTLRIPIEKEALCRV